VHYILTHVGGLVNCFFHLSFPEIGKSKRKAKSYLLRYNR